MGTSIAGKVDRILDVGTKDLKKLTNSINLNDMTDFDESARCTFKNLPRAPAASYVLKLQLLKTTTTNVVRNAGCARSRYTLKLSLRFFKSLNQSINRVYLERLIRR